MKVAAVISGCRGKLQDHLLARALVYTTYAKVKDDIYEYFDVRKAYNHPGTRTRTPKDPNAMDTTPMGPKALGVGAFAGSPAGGGEFQSANVNGVSANRRPCWFAKY